MNSVCIIMTSKLSQLCPNSTFLKEVYNNSLKLNGRYYDKFVGFIFIHLPFFILTLCLQELLPYIIV